MKVFIKVLFDCHSLSHSKLQMLQTGATLQKYSLSKLAIIENLRNKMDNMEFSTVLFFKPTQINSTNDNEGYLNSQKIVNFGA